MDSMTSWKHHGVSQSNKSAQMKDEGGNAALIPGSSAWGALKGGTSQKPLILSSDGSALSGEKTSPKPSSGEKSWPPSCSAMHINGIVSRWSSSSSSGANGAWADNKDIGSGWGSPNSSPIPNAGTEVWSAQKQSVEGASSRWGASNAPGLVWGGNEVKNDGESDSKSVWAQTGSQPGVWGDSRAVSMLSQTSNHWGSREQCSNWGSSSPQPTTAVTQSSTLSTWAQAASHGLCAVALGKSANSAPGSNMSREELIVRAINSQDGWGQTPVRQDTAWDVTVEPSVTNVACKISSQTEPSAQPGQQASNTGTAIWEASKDSAPVLSSELSSHTLLASSGHESIVGKLPWVGSETNMAAGWEVPLHLEGSALLCGERSLSSIKSGTNSIAWSALMDTSKDSSMSAVNPWNLTNSSGKVSEPVLSGSCPQTASIPADVGASQCGALAALLEKYERQSSASAAVWDSTALQPDRPTDATAVKSSPTWGGPSVPAAPLPGGGLVGPDQRNDIWSQTGASKSAHWGSSQTSDNAIWSSATLVSGTFSSTKVVHLLLFPLVSLLFV